MRVWLNDDGSITTSRRAGFSLLEMIVVFWALSVAIVLGATLLLAAMRADQVGANMLRRMGWWTQLTDEFRGDVARASATPERLGDLTRGPACLILATTGGAHVIWQWQEGRLDRIVRAADGSETRQQMTVETQDVTIEFERSGLDRPLVTLRLTEAPAHGAVRRAEVSAALGGDLR